MLRYAVVRRGAKGGAFVSAGSLCDVARRACLCAMCVVG